LARSTPSLGRGSEFEASSPSRAPCASTGCCAARFFSDDVLIVGEGARGRGLDRRPARIIIQGTVNGNIKAKRSIEILAPGRVKGECLDPGSFARSTRGVMFEGRSFMEGFAEKLAPKKPEAGDRQQPEPARSRRCRRPSRPAPPPK